MHMLVLNAVAVHLRGCFRFVCLFLHTNTQDGPRGTECAGQAQPEADKEDLPLMTKCK